MKITAVDLFCGIGGLTHGLKLAGIAVAAGFDIDPTCKYAYEENNDATFMEADIAKVQSSEISQFYGEKDIKVLVGCAPCQPFSKYTMRYRKNKVKNENGEKNHDKWGLVGAFADRIREILPDIVSMENVPELEDTEVFHSFIATLKESGYYISYSVAYCPDYGVPQSRRRLVLLASRFSEIFLIGPEYLPENYITVRQAIESLPKLQSGKKNAIDNLHFCSDLSEINLKRIKASRQGGSWRDWNEELQLKCHKKSTGKTYGSVYGRMSWDLPSPTITTQFYGYGNGRFGHPQQDRAISIREGAILQSFPPGYKLVKEGDTVRTRTLGTHIGNAVPVELGRAIGTSILEHLKECDLYGTEK
ncbi:MAG: DNA cytosine methyltransferase [Oscillospiraceae bacterium]|nr:DNA cytosine methyltransferase [Oscillospiraceae bacterium]